MILFLQARKTHFAQIGALYDLKSGLCAHDLDLCDDEVEEVDDENHANNAYSRISSAPDRSSLQLI